MTTSLWLAIRYFGSWRRFFTLTTSLSVIGMAIGVASLVVSMAVFSGYVSTLEQTLQDAVGHVWVLKRGAGDSDILKDIRPMVPGLLAETPFVYGDAIVAGKGQINGIAIEGIETTTVRKVLRLQDRIVQGRLDLASGPNELPKVMIGKVIAERFGLKLGDKMNIIVPLASEYQAASFRPKLGKFVVAAIVNYGRYDFDSRYVAMDIAQAQDFLEIGKKITGYRLRIKDPAKARAIAQDISEKSGGNYYARDWMELNRNLLEAARLEKAVLFFVLMILVIAAAFNIANTLFISVVQRYRDISVLKTLGAQDRLIRGVFTFQGLIVGAVGALCGIGAGLGLCRVFEWAQVRWKLIPADVYKLDHIKLDVRVLDLLAIVAASMLVCLIATLVPSRRGSRISPVEGLRYE